jgi:uncharacterized protein (DUF1778 family)
MAQAIRTERMEARLLPAQKKRIEQAATIKGLSVSDFVVQYADEAAIRTIEQHERWVLSDRDRDAFVQALLNPPKLSGRLKEAIKRNRERMGK